LALAGKADDAAAAAILANAYFGREPPKSLDRDHFDASPVARLSPEDGAATLVAVTARSAALATRFFPQPVKRWLVCGGGRRNPAIMRALAAAIHVPVDPVETVGWDGDALEAQAFAYLALRSLDGLPLSFPRTTGVPKLGLTVAPANSVAGAGREGVVVTEVDPKSAAAERGFKEGDVILEVAGKSVTNAGDVREAINTARADNKNSVLMRVKTGASSRFVAVPLAKG
jgi:membrane-associated protease RseP (regulator of RpoE activity)